jgi:hypothetical protein
MIEIKQSSTTKYAQPSRIDFSKNREASMPKSAFNKAIDQSNAANSSFGGRANSRQRIRLNKAEIKA